MSNVALLSFDTRSNKWIATVSGKVLATSPNKEYVVNMIKTGRCTKAVLAGVTTVREAASEEAVPEQQNEKFGINERFEFLVDFVRMVADRTAPSLIITGEGGLGKTFTVNATLKESGLQNSADSVGCGSDSALLETQSRQLYTVVKGYSTPKGLYRTLYENRNRVIVFDDCDSVLRDPVALNLLKGALDSYDKRVICWNAEAWGDDDLPRRFEFTGGVIFISNMTQGKIDAAVRTRSICVDLSMSAAQRIERMGAIIGSPEFLPEYSDENKKSALSFLESMASAAKEINLRTLISITKIAARGGAWQRRAEYLLSV
jgi:hypothetical protein